MAAVRPAILCGGIGSRLWPLSSDRRPKQFHALAGEGSLLRQTIERGMAIRGARRPIVVTGAAYGDLVRDEAIAAGQLDALAILEPERRNTAASAALAALAAAEDDPDSIVVLLPSDHHVADAPAFIAAIDEACDLAAEGFIVVLGIEPDGPNTGFGYVRRGEPAGAGFRVAAFVEKPDLEKARRLLEAGDCYWNAGVYVFRASVFLDELKAHAPDTDRAVRAAWRAGRTDGTTRQVDAALWHAAPDLSVDHAVAEKTRRAALVPVSAGWNDVGNWAALRDIAAADADGNVLIGAARASRSHGCYVRAGSRPVVVIGGEDLIVVDSPDGVLVVRRDLAQSVKDFAAAPAGPAKGVPEA